MFCLMLRLYPVLPGLHAAEALGSPACTGGSAPALFLLCIGVLTTEQFFPSLVSRRRAEEKKKRHAGNAAKPGMCPALRLVAKPAIIC